MLDNFSLSIPASAKIALVGHSGCGKSTVTNMLLRFYNVQSGRITIDGKDLRDYDVASLRKQIGFVMQEPVLFNTSIKENILYGDLHASDEQVLKVAEMANALSFIESKIESMDRDKRVLVQKEELRKMIADFAAHRPGISALSDRLYDETQLSLLLQTLQKADSILLDNIAENSEMFIELLVRESKIAGMRWDILVISFEWLVEYEQTMADPNLDSAQKAQVKTAAKSLKYCFNRAMVDSWAAQATAEEEDFSTYARRNASVNAESRQARLKQLRDAFIDKMRDASGKVQMHKGFEKQCGLKGQKLSGG